MPMLCNFGITLTVILAEILLSITDVAVMVAVPSLTPVMPPFTSTLTTFSSELVHNKSGLAFVGLITT